MRVLVTGATGFLGADLTHRLLDEGARVRALVRHPARARWLARRGVALIIGDITDEPAVRAAVDGVDAVNHLAGRLYEPGVPASRYHATHVEGTRTLLAALAALARQGNRARLVHASTTGVLGVTGARPADESAPYRPTNPYEASKLEAELLVRAAWEDGLPAVIVRTVLVYGPGDLHLLGFFRAIQRGLFHPIGRRPVWLHPIYSADMSAALLRCGDDPRALGQCFHIAADEPVTLAALAATIARALGVRQPRGVIPLPVARLLAASGDALPARWRPLAPLTTSRLDFLTHSRVYQVALARDVLGFAAAVPLAEGIARTVAWYRREGLLPADGGSARAPIAAPIAGPLPAGPRAESTAPSHA